MVVLARLLAHISDYLSPVSSRGFGLFIGVEIVKDGSAREPDGELAKELIEGSVVAHVQNQQSRSSRCTSFKRVLVLASSPGLPCTREKNKQAIPL